MSIHGTVTSALTRSSGSEDELVTPGAVFFRNARPTGEKVTTEGATAPAAAAAAASPFTGTGIEEVVPARRACLPAL